MHHCQHSFPKVFGLWEMKQSRDSTYWSRHSVIDAFGLRTSSKQGCLLIHSSEKSSELTFKYTVHAHSSARPVCSSMPTPLPCPRQGPLPPFWPPFSLSSSSPSSSYSSSFSFSSLPPSHLLPILDPWLLSLLNARVKWNSNNPSGLTLCLYQTDKDIT